MVTTVATASGDPIGALDYNTIRDKIIPIIGVGSADKGYGQAVQSTAVFEGNTATKAQWDALRFDITNAKLHQDGVLPPIVEIQKTTPIRYGPGNPNTDYSILADIAVSNRFTVAAGQTVLSSKANATLETAWGALATCELTLTFLNSNDARYFFNSGGKIKFTSTRTGGAATSQNNAWTSLLSTVGTQAFSADPGLSINFYKLTNSYQTFYIRSTSTPYSDNNFKLEAKSNVADNIGGTATQVIIKISWVDAYVDPDTLQAPGSSPASNAPNDTVDGILTINVEETKATGTLYPYGSFTIASPTYSLSAISTS
jgi:hypothetical protein